jgi:hypothetical protein
MYSTLASDTSFSPDSRVWVYVSARPLTEAETEWMQPRLDAFTQQWTAHNAALKAKAEVLDGQMVILMVDETQAGASGCSIDKSVHFLENLGQAVGTDLFERMRFGWVENDRLRFEHRDVLSTLVQSGAVTEDTAMVNTLALTKRDLTENWLKPFGKSWHKRLI